LAGKKITCQILQSLCSTASPFHSPHIPEDMRTKIITTLVEVILVTDALDLHYECEELLKIIAVDGGLAGEVVSCVLPLLRHKNVETTLDEGGQEAAREKFMLQNIASSKAVCAIHVLGALVTEGPELADIVVNHGSVPGLLFAFLFGSDYDSQQVGYLSRQTFMQFLTVP
jgi:hypothetical protein